MSKRAALKKQLLQEQKQRELADLQQHQQRQQEEERIRKYQQQQQQQQLYNYEVATNNTFGTDEDEENHQQQQQQRPVIYINLWPAAGRGREVTQPFRMNVFNQTSMPHILEKAATACECRPAAPYLLTPDGQRVKSASQFEHAGHYLVVPSGCRYSKQDVPTALLELLVD